MSDHTFTLPISQPELLALIKHHTNCARRVPKALGAALMKHRASSVLPSARRSRALQEEAESILKFHTTRAKELIAILKP